MTKSSRQYLATDDEQNESLLIHDISRLLSKNFSQRVRSMGLTRSQWQTLSTIRRNPGISQVHLAERLEVAPITIARTIDRLQKAGWIERRADANDRRVNRLFLTPRVKEVVGRMRVHGLETRHVALAGIGPRDHAALLHLLAVMRSNLCQKSKEKNNA